MCAKAKTRTHGLRASQGPPASRQSSPDDGRASTGEQFIPQIETEIAGVRFRNPVWTASGTFGYGKEFSSLIDLNELGAIVVKGISPEPMEGNPPPRIYETESGMLNAIGLQNVGARRFLTEKLPFLRTLRARCIVNVFAYSTEDYVRCLEILNEGEGIAAYELNISCPNTRCGGMVYGSDPKLTEEVVAASKKAARYPLFVKLSPNVTDVASIAVAAEKGGADAITAVNTLKAMAIDADFRRPILSNVTGGLSGPAIKSVSLRCVWEIAEVVKVPIIGCGGVSSWRDAIEFILAGASMVQIGTAVMNHGFEVYGKVNDGVRRYLHENGFGSVSEVVGLAHKR